MYSISQLPRGYCANTIARRTKSGVVERLIIEGARTVERLIVDEEIGAQFQNASRQRGDERTRAPDNRFLIVKSGVDEDALFERKVLCKRELSRFVDKIKSKKERASRSLIVNAKSWKPPHLEATCRSIGPHKITYFRVQPDTPAQALIEFKNTSCAQEMMHEFSSKTPQRILTKPNIAMRCPEKGGNVGATEQLSVDSPKILKLISDQSNLSDMLYTLHLHTRLTQLQDRINYLVCQAVDDACTLSNLNAYVIPHGSALSGIATKNSDLDLMVDVTDTPTAILEGSDTVVSRSDAQRVLRKTRIRFRDVQDFFAVHSILHARVPIIRFRSHASGMRCDVCVSQEILLDNSICASYLMSKLVSLDDRVAPLLMGVKCWARHQCLTSDSTGAALSNFTLNHLVIYFLQYMHILPPTNELCHQPGKADSKSVDAQSHSHFTKSNSSIGELYKEFFKFFAAFDFDRVIDIRIGPHVPSPYASRGGDKNLYIVNTQAPTLNIGRLTNENRVKRLQFCLRETEAELANGRNTAELFLRLHGLLPMQGELRCF